MASKKSIKVKQEIIDMVQQVINNTNANQAKGYLFIGKAYDMAFDEVYSKICYTRPIDIFSVNDADFSFKVFLKFCAECQYVEGRFVVLRLKCKAAIYQTGLLVPLERLKLPLLVFADTDGFLDSFMSRFKQEQVYKQSDENLQTTAFIPPNKVLSKPTIESPYVCPSLIKLGEYSKLPLSCKKLDIQISKLSDGNVYPEVLSELQPPIKSFSSDAKLEALSLLKKQVNYQRVEV